MLRTALAHYYAWRALNILIGAMAHLTLQTRATAAKYGPMERILDYTDAYRVVLQTRISHHAIREALPTDPLAHLFGELGKVAYHARCAKFHKLAAIIWGQNNA